MKDDQTQQTEAPACASLQFHAKPAHRVLVVDDELMPRNLNTRMLVDNGYHVDAVEDGAVVWDTLQLRRSAEFLSTVKSVLCAAVALVMLQLCLITVQ